MRVCVKVDKAGIDILLVGDSAGMVIHGHDTTVPVTLDMMLLHCQAVSRGASRPFLLGDMPFGTYEVSKEQAVSTAMQFLKQGNVDAVKVEGEPGKVATSSIEVHSTHACMVSAHLRYFIKKKFVASLPVSLHNMHAQLRIPANFTHSASL